MWLKQSAPRDVKPDELNISFNEEHGGYVIYAPWDESQYVTTIGDITFGFGPRYLLGDLIENKIKDRYPETIPSYMIKTEVIPHLSSPIKRRLGKQKYPGGPIENKIDEQRKRFWLRPTTPYGWTEMSGTTTENAIKSINRPEERWWY